MANYAKTNIGNEGVERQIVPGKSRMLNRLQMAG